MAKFHRKTIAAILLLALFVFGAPSLGLAGGCDEPGYTGGSCNKSSGQSTSGGDLPGDGLPDEPGDSTGGGGSGGLALPGTGQEAATGSWGILGDLARTVLTWLAVSTTP